MNFKFKTFSLLCAGMLMGLTACNNDDLIEGGKNGEGDGKYFHVQAGISLPTVGGTRSATDDDISDGTHSNSDAEAEVEQGYDYENEIRTMILVYADANNNYITHSVVKGITKAPVSGKAYDYEVIGEIAHENLEAAYADGGILEKYDGTQDIHVFAICNYTARLEQLFNDADSKTTKADWINWTGSVEEDASPAGHTPIIQNTIWAPRSFLMTNYEIAKVKFPASIDAWDEYTDRSTPWILNKEGEQDGDVEAIKVEHVAARIDFRDASNSKLKESKKEGNWSNTYDLLLHENSYNDQEDPDQKNSGDLNIISIKLTRMALVNMSKNFYYLPRVSADGLASNFTLCGYEKSNNFVVDTDAQDKYDGNINASNEGTYFNFPLYTSDGTYNKTAWYVDNIDEVLKRQADQWNAAPKEGKYHIWRYVTENTIPGAKNQITGQSTGVIFKGNIVAGADIDAARADDYVSEALVNALANVNDPDKGQGKAVRLYSFENRLFAGPEDIIAGANADGENSALYNAVKKVLAKWKSADDGKTYKYEGDGTMALEPKIANAILKKIEGYNEGYTIEGLDDENFYKSNTPQSTQIAVYEASDENDGEGWGYYCYYFYWNRHNDNSKAGLMGPMEFATVRNNVYKLAVTKINRIGHPTKPGDDPDPEEFDDPDEPPTNYIQVQVDVLPWVVRVNNIEF